MQKSVLSNNLKENELKKRNNQHKDTCSIAKNQNAAGWGSAL